MAGVKDIYLLSLLAQNEGMMGQLLPYLIEGKEIPSEIKYRPLSSIILQNLDDKVAEMKQDQKDRLLAALILERMGDTQAGEFRDALVLIAHEEIKDVLGSLTTLAEKKEVVASRAKESKKVEASLRGSVTKR